MDRIQAGYVVGPFSLMASAGILVEIDVILGGVFVGFGVVGREISGLLSSGLYAGLRFRVGILDAVCDLVTAPDLPRLGVRGGGFEVCGKSSGSRLLLDPLLIYI